MNIFFSENNIYKKTCLLCMSDNCSVTLFRFTNKYDVSDVTH